MIGAAATEPLFPALMKPLLDGGFAAAHGATALVAGALCRGPGRHLRRCADC